MRLALANEFELIVRDQVYQRISHRPKQACRAAIPLVNIDLEFLRLAIPFQPSHRATCLKHLINHSEIGWNAFHCSVYHSP